MSHLTQILTAEIKASPWLGKIRGRYCIVSGCVWLGCFLLKGSISAKTGFARGIHEDVEFVWPLRPLEKW